MKNKLFLFILAVILISCKSLRDSDDNLRQGRSTISIRLEQIEKQIHERPVNALNLIEIFKETYAHTKSSDDDNEDWKHLYQLEKEALNNLRTFQEKAI